jgi:hypothetical protein
LGKKYDRVITAGYMLGSKTREEKSRGITAELFTPLHMPEKKNKKKKAAYTNTRAKLKRL